MLRKLITLIIAANFIFMLLGIISTTNNLIPTFADTSISAQAGAVVDPILELISGGIKQIPHDAPPPPNFNPWSYNNATNGFDFGTLQQVFDASGNFLYMTGDYFYCVLMMAITSGRSYEITQTAGTLVGDETGAVIDDRSFLVTPVYTYNDELGGQPQGAMPQDAECGPVNSAVVGAPHLIYRDQSDIAETRVIQGYISIGGPPEDEDYPVNFEKGYNEQGVGQGTEYQYENWQPVGQNQAADTYASADDVVFTLSLI